MVAEIVFADKPFVKFVAPLTVPPVNGVVNPVILGSELPKLLFNVKLPLEYVPPVIVVPVTTLPELSNPKLITVAQLVKVFILNLSTYVVFYVEPVILAPNTIVFELQAKLLLP